MFTCALMHGVYALYVTTGRYDLDIHGLVIDWLSVPAAAYFLWVVAALHRGTPARLERGRRRRRRAPTVRALGHRHGGVGLMATVLVVDDDADIRTLLQIALERDGHRVDGAPGGTAGLAALREPERSDRW